MNIDERVVSIKFDNSGFEEKVSETQKSLNNLNDSLNFSGAQKGSEALTDSLKSISEEAKKTDLSPVSDSVDTIKEKFSILGTVATGALYKIGAEAVELGKNLISSITVDPIAQGFDKYQDILTSQMTLTAALGGETEEEIQANAEKIQATIDQLTWYADETSYALDDMIKNVSTFANYGVDLDDAKTAMMGIANASAKSGAPLAAASHAMEGFSKAMGQGYMSYQVWRSWLNTSHITTLDFKNTFVDTAKEMIRSGADLGDQIRLMGDDLEYYKSKEEGWQKVTAENIESSLSTARWLTSDVMIAGLSKYSASMDELYEATEHGAKAVSDVIDEAGDGLDEFSTQAFLYAQQCKTLTDVIDALFDATSTTWYRIFQSLIGDYKQTVDLWSNFAEYLFEWFVYPLQDFAKMIKEFAESNSNIIDETTGKVMTMREVIVDSFMNILEAITSVINPIKEAFSIVFNPFETLPKKLQNGTEKFHDFTEALILTEEEAFSLRNKFIILFTTLKKIWSIIKTVVETVKKIIFPIIKKVSQYAVKAISAIAKVLYKLISTISTFVSEVFGITDFVEELKYKAIDAAYEIDEMTSSLEDNLDEIKDIKDAYSDLDDDLEDVSDSYYDAADSVDAFNDSLSDIDDSSVEAANDKQEELNKAIKDFLDQEKLSTDQYNKVVQLLSLKESGRDIKDEEIARSAGIDIDTYKRLLVIINQLDYAYKETEKSVLNLTATQTEAAKWATIWDGINKVEKETLITQGNRNEALRLYFKEGIKDYSEIAKAIGEEEYVIRQVISAYEEAYAIEKKLNEKGLEATADNIDSVRAELGYIERKNEAQNASIKSSNKIVRSGKSILSVIGTAIKRIPVIGKVVTSLEKVFGIFRRNTSKVSTSVDKSSDEISSAIEKATKGSGESFITTKKTIDSVSETTQKATNTASKMSEVISDVGKTSKKASKDIEEANKKIKESNDDLEESELSFGEQMEKAFADLDKNNLNFKSITDAIKNAFSVVSTWIGDHVKNIWDNVKDYVSKKWGELASKELQEKVNKIISKIKEFGTSAKELFSNIYGYIKEFFKDPITGIKNIVSDFKEAWDNIGNYISKKWEDISSKTITENLEPIWFKMKELGNIVKITFSNISEDLKGFFEAPLSTIVTVIGDLKDGFMSIIESLFKNEDGEPGVLGASDILSEQTKSKLLTSIDELLINTWKKIKDFFKNKVNNARNDEENPFHGIVSMFDNIINWWDDFSYDIKFRLGQIKDFINVFFGKGSVLDKLSNSSLWRPFLTLLSDAIDKMDYMRDIVSAIKDGFKSAFESLDENIKAPLDNANEKIKDFIENIKTFDDRVNQVRENLNSGKPSGGSGGNPESSGGLAGIIGGLLSKWDKFKAKIEEGLDWEEIGKISALETVLERIIRAIANAWISIGIVKMGQDISGFFLKIGEGINSLIDAISGNKDIGEILLKIAGALAIMTVSLMALAQIDEGSLNTAVKAIGELAGILTAVAAVMVIIINLFKISSAKKGYSKIEGNSVGEILANGLGQAIGNKDTMSKAGAMLVGIAAGIAILAGALAVIVDVVKTVEDPKDIWMAVLILGALGIVLSVLFLAISKISSILDGKSGDSNGKAKIAFNFKNKEISKNISTTAEILKGVAVALGVMIAAFLAIYIVLSRAKVTDNVEVVVLSLGILAAMLVAIYIFARTLSSSSKDLESVDPKVLEGFSSIMKALAIGLAAMVYSFKVLVGIITNASTEDPEAIGKASALFFGMLGAILIFIIGTLAMCRFLLGEKSSSKELNTVTSSKSKSLLKSKEKGVNTKNAGDILKAVATLITSIGFAIKLMASAFSSIVDSIEGMKKPKTWSTSLITLGVMLGSLGVFLLEIIFITKNIKPGTEKVMSKIALIFLSIGISIKLMADGIGDLAKTFDKVNPDSMMAAAITIGVLFTVVLSIFAMIAAFVFASPTGGASLETAVAIFNGLAVGILLISSSIYVLAKGIEELVIAFSQISSAKESFLSGLNTLKEALPDITYIISEIISAIIMGIINGLTDGMEKIFSTIGIILEQILSLLSEFLPKIASFLEENKDSIITIITDLLQIVFVALNNALPQFAEFFNNLQNQVIYPALTRLFDWLENEGVPRLLSILQQIIDFLIGEPNGFLYQLEDAIFGFIVWLGDLGEEIINSLTRIWNAIQSFITDTVFPGLRTVWQELLNLIDGLITDLLTFLENGVTGWGNKIIDIIVALIEVIENGVKRITDALESLLLTIANSVYSFFETGGRVLAKLLLIPKAIADGFMKEIKEKFGISDNGTAKTNGSIYKFGKNIVDGLIAGIKALFKSIKDAAKWIWDTFKTAFTSKENANIESPSKATEKFGEYIGEGLVNGINGSGKAVSKSAKNLWTSFSEPMTDEMTSFSAVTSSMLSQLLDANMDFDPVITPVFDMSNLDAASSSMSEFFDSKNAMDVSASFNAMNASKSASLNNQNVGDSQATNGAAFTYVQNNYSPKALSEIEIYRRTKNQLVFKTMGG